MSGATTPTVAEAPALAALDERDVEPRTPMKRLGSTRKLAAFNNIRVQLCEQTRVLEGRAEAAAGVAGELSDYCRRRADLEHEYSRALDKLARAAHQRHKDQKHKREQWPLTGAFSCWQAALENTRALSRDHAALGELYGGPLAARLQRAADDALRLHRKCRDIVSERHEELGASLSEAGAAGKAHAAAAAEWRAAALKLRHAREQRDKLQQADPPRQKKIKAVDKELEKRRVRHAAARGRALRARADYTLSLEAANATLQRYYLDDIADIMLCMEVGFEAVVGRCVRAAAAAESGAATAANAGAAALLAAAEALDALTDRQRLVAAHAQAFAPPRPLPFRGQQPQAQDTEMRELVEGAAEAEDETTAAVGAELAARLAQLEVNARRLRAECREHAKTLDAAEAELVRQMEGAAIDVSGLFGRAAAQEPPPAPPPDDDGPRRDQEDYYLAKFRSYVSCAGRLARLESKAAAVRARLGAAGVSPGGRLSPPSPPRRAQLRRGLFAAPLLDQQPETLPKVLTSCVRVIATYGLRHQGIFRVSGSQVEMQALRAAFERGEDPLAAVRDASDINSVCGLLKLYLRELRPPLVPSSVAEALLRAGSAPGSEAEVTKRLKEALQALPTPNMIVLRYLTAFLAHLTEYSEANMMDAWNLAICVGPTLLAARGAAAAQVAAQNQGNELVKRLIHRHKAIFPQDVAPHTLYTKFSEAPQPEPEEPEDEADGDAGDGADDDVDDADDGDDGDQDPDMRDDLSLYADDDVFSVGTDDVSEDGESGEWRDRDVNAHHRSGSGERQLPALHQQAREPSPVNAVASASSSPLCRRLAETTPDLVLDLPARAADAPDAADTFAHNRDTLKKRPAHKHTNSEGSADGREPTAEPAEAVEPAETAEAAPETPEPIASGSPVPARNTARVAAKFADLTLTGGSLKPALAAKPALLRRPTPHPQHARPTPIPASPPAVPPPAQPPHDPPC